MEGGADQLKVIPGVASAAPQSVKCFLPRLQREEERKWYWGKEKDAEKHGGAVRIHPLLPDSPDYPGILIIPYPSSEYVPWFEPITRMDHNWILLHSTDLLVKFKQIISGLIDSDPLTQNFHTYPILPFFYRILTSQRTHAYYHKLIRSKIEDRSSPLKQNVICRRECEITVKAINYDWK